MLKVYRSKMDRSENDLHMLQRELNLARRGNAFLRMSSPSLVNGSERVTKQPVNITALKNGSSTTMESVRDKQKHVRVNTKRTHARLLRPNRAGALRRSCQTAITSLSACSLKKSRSMGSERRNHSWKYKHR